MGWFSQSAYTSMSRSLCTCGVNRKGGYPVANKKAGEARVTFQAEGIKKRITVTVVKE